MLSTYLIALAVGVGAEVTARTGRLWIYRNPDYPVINVLVMFGLLMGGLSLAIPALGVIPVLLIATAFGYGYELLNFALLKWWDFPEDRFLVFRGQQACALSVGVLWGCTPLIVHYLGSIV